MFSFLVPTFRQGIFRKPNPWGELSLWSSKGEGETPGRVRGNWYPPPGHGYFQTDRRRRGREQLKLGSSLHCGYQEMTRPQNSWMGNPCTWAFRWLQIKVPLPGVWHSPSRESRDPEAPGSRTQWPFKGNLWGQMSDNQRVGLLLF